MKTVLFPTRGGPASYPNRDRVIALAKEEEARLIFMYVADVRFLNLVMSPVLVDIEAEIEEMGEFMLAMAQERASEESVEADIIVRRGIFREALTTTIDETGADVVVLGAPIEGTGVTTPAYRKGLIHQVIDETGVQIVVVDEGEIIERWHPGNLPEM